jgi:Ca2+-binding EF-hand superfamily protein
MSGMSDQFPRRCRSAVEVLLPSLAVLLLGSTGSPKTAWAQTPLHSAKWSVPARVFPANTEVAKPTEAPMPPRPAESATSASPLPPVYHTSSRSLSSSDSQPGDATIRFIVTLAERPLLVEAKITIDRKPFRMVREARIEALLKELKKSAPDQAAAQPADESDGPLLARLRRHAEATQRPPSHDEVRWLLSHWLAGPASLPLDENFQRVRASASPLFKLLDRDEDQVISPAEIAQAEQSLWKYDSNQDEVLSLAEINKGAERTPDSAGTLPVAPPLIPIQRLAMAAVFQRLCQSYNDALRRFDPDADGRLSQAELAELATAPVDLAIAVDFDTQSSDRSTLAVTGADPALVKEPPIIRESSLVLLVGRTWLELSAVQSASGRGTDHISFGAVRDGYPLLPKIDVNEDGRLTVRELRQIAEGLKTFDRSGDGAIAKTELLPTLRLSFGHGPIVHRQLETVRSLHSRSTMPTVTPPEWFTRMDRNNDEDVTPREFLGAKEQFAALDADGDGLISAIEASQRKSE